MNEYTETIGLYSVTYLRWNTKDGPGFFDLKAIPLNGNGGIFMPNAGRLFEARNWAHKMLRGRGVRK